MMFNRRSEQDYGRARYHRRVRATSRAKSLRREPGPGERGGLCGIISPGRGKHLGTIPGRRKQSTNIRVPAGTPNKGRTLYIAGAGKPQHYKISGEHAGAFEGSLPWDRTAKCVLAVRRLWDAGRAASPRVHGQTVVFRRRAWAHRTAGAGRARSREPPAFHGRGWAVGSRRSGRGGELKISGGFLLSLVFRGGDRICGQDRGFPGPSSTPTSIWGLPARGFSFGTDKLHPRGTSSITLIRLAYYGVGAIPGNRHRPQRSRLPAARRAAHRGLALFRNRRPRFRHARCRAGRLVRCAIPPTGSPRSEGTHGCAGCSAAKESRHEFKIWVDDARATVSKLKPKPLSGAIIDEAQQKHEHSLWLAPSLPHILFDLEGRSRDLAGGRAFDGFCPMILD